MACNAYVYQYLSTPRGHIATSCLVMLQTLTWMCRPLNSFLNVIKIHRHNTKNIESTTQLTIISNNTYLVTDEKMFSVLQVVV